MALWPGWNSVDSAGSWSHFYFWFGIVCLFLLGASEIVSHLYGLRKDELVAIAERTRGVEQQRQEGELRQELSAAGEKVAALEAKQAARRLSPYQKTFLTAALAGSPGQRVAIFCSQNAWDASDLAGDILSVLRDAKWDFQPPISFGLFIGQDVAGVRISLNDKIAQNPKLIPPGVPVLAEALARLGITPTPVAIVADPHLADDLVWIQIGRIP